MKPVVLDAVARVSAFILSNLNPDIHNDTSQLELVNVLNMRCYKNHESVVASPGPPGRLT